MCAYGEVDPALNRRKPPLTQHRIEPLLDRSLRQSNRRTATGNFESVIPFRVIKKVVSDPGWTRGMALIAKMAL
jgi:hypothetical protein